jgi:hypothetical protein
VTKKAFDKIAAGLREAIALTTHEFGTSEFCVNCGQSRERISDQQINCFGGGNLVAISHLRRAPTEPDASDFDWNVPA